MLWTFVFLLLVLWTVGLVTSLVPGGVVHVPLLAALVLVAIGVSQRWRLA
jgi:hypothetical protein